LKILQVVPYFPPAYAFGGPVIVSYQISKELVRRNNQITIYSSDAKDMKTRICLSDQKISDSMQVYYFRIISMKIVEWLNLFITPGLFIRGNKEIKNFDLIHLHEYYTFQNIIISYLADKFNIPYVVQTHGSLTMVGAHKKWKWLYNACFGFRILKNASKIIALNKMEAQQCNSMGILDNKIVIIPNGLDLSQYANLSPKNSFKNKYNITNHQKIILYLGRIHKTKGIDLLIKAFAYLFHEMKYFNALLVIAGPDDGYLNEARSLVSSLGVSDLVLFTGFINNQDKISVLVDSDVFVTPSFYGFPITFLEACATGTPIITTNFGDKLEWIDGQVGYVTTFSHNELAKAIYAVISNDELREKFSKNCITIVRSKFSLENVVTQLEEIYQEISKEKFR
jgi:glycosyltransferase involved in cell wall biosynthesis